MIQPACCLHYNAYAQSHYDSMCPEGDFQGLQYQEAVRLIMLFLGNISAFGLTGMVVYFIINGLHRFLTDSGTVVPVNLTDEFYFSPLSGTCGQRVKHRYIFVRHGETDHNKTVKKFSIHSHNDTVESIDRSDTPDTTSSNSVDVDSNLTNAGHEQAHQVASFFAKIGLKPDRIVVSPMKRTVDTAAPTLGLMKDEIDSGEVELIFDPRYQEINIWNDTQVGYEPRPSWSEKETFTKFTRRMNDKVDMMEAESQELVESRQTVVFTHSMVISEILNHLANRISRTNVSDTYWSDIYWQVNNGSITCIDFTENDFGREEWHIQAMNYCGHLSTHTGTKSPFV